MAAGPQIISVLDVLDNALGEDARSAALEKLTLAQLDNIAELLGEFWNAQPDVDGETDREDRASFVGGWMGPFWSEQMLRQDLSGALLYYPKILVLDPLADFFSHGEGLPTPWTVGYVRPDRQINTVSNGPAIWCQQGTFDSMRSEPIAAAGRFAHIVRNLYSLEKPIRTGVIVVRSQWSTLKANAPQLATAVRHHVQSGALQEFLETADMSELQVWDNLHESSRSSERHSDAGRAGVLLPSEDARYRAGWRRAIRAGERVVARIAQDGVKRIGTYPSCSDAARGDADRGAVRGHPHC